jgi:chloramphenicol-sensitive protein RarD
MSAVDPRKRLGLVYGLAAYGSWGLFPIYLKAVARVPVVEVLSHRVVWSAIGLLVLAWTQGSLADIGAALRNPQALRILCASTVLIAVNWLVYIFSVVHSRMLESSLGYYINPLVSVLLGVVLLGERLAPLVRVAVGIAAAGVLGLTWHMGRLPWISIALACSFALYGLMRKLAPVGALTGIAVETLLLSPLAAAYLVWAGATGRAAFLSGDVRLDVLLVLAGPVTAIPLLWFAGAARRLPLSTMGFLQYLSPTLQFLLAVLVYQEPFDRAKGAAFACIWLALAVFAYHLLSRPAPRAAAAA